MDLSPGEITQLLNETASGDRAAAARVFPLIYNELRRCAAAQLRHERPNHTLQPTALINEAYVRLAQQREVRWENRAEFFAMASYFMRRILVDYARKRQAAKRGSVPRQLSLEEAYTFTDDRAEELLALDRALEQLKRTDSQQSRVVELRFFGGLSVEETARYLNVSERTVKRDWSHAKYWLHAELVKQRTAGQPSHAQP